MNAVTRAKIHLYRPKSDGRASSGVCRAQYPLRTELIAPAINLSTCFSPAHRIKQLGHPMAVKLVLAGCSAGRRFFARRTGGETGSTGRKQGREACRGSRTRNRVKQTQLPILNWP